MNEGRYDNLGIMMPVTKFKGRVEKVRDPSSLFSGEDKLFIVEGTMDVCS